MRTDPRVETVADADFTTYAGAELTLRLALKWRNEDSCVAVDMALIDMALSYYRRKVAS